MELLPIHPEAHRDLYSPRSSHCHAGPADHRPGGGVLRAEVTDDGADGTRPFVRTDPGGESGRGRHIVAALAKTSGHPPDGPGTTVWADIPSARPA
jgi:hypothetical protein